MTSASVVLLLWLAAGAEPEVIETVEHYDVTGVTAAQLRASIEENRPEGIPLSDGAARTRWELDFAYAHAMVNGECAITGVRTSVEITVTLPRWPPEPSAPQALIDQWDTALAALEEHEEGHAKIGRDGALALLRRLEDLKPAPDCARLRAALWEAVNELREEHRERAADTIFVRSTGLRRGPSSTSGPAAQRRDEADQGCSA